MLLSILFLLVPAPKDKPAPVDPLVGAWTFWWNAGEQTTHFYADGTCWSPEYGSGTWQRDDDQAIWFSERDGTAQYVMVIDWATGHGSGWYWSRGELGSKVDVAIRRGERLPAPREAR